MSFRADRDSKARKRLNGVCDDEVRARSRPPKNRIRFLRILFFYIEPLTCFGRYYVFL